MSQSMHQCMLAVLLATVVLLVQPASGRSLQQDALSNSNGCLSTILKCEPGACATRNVMGTARWVCLRCLSNYQPVVTADGQDNIVQCVCPKGHFENGTNAISCTRCEKNQFCPGGEQVENPTNRGNPVECGNGLVTRNTGARSQSDCVAPGGYAMTSPTAAAPCARSEYAPQFNRLAKCLRCQSGLEEPMASNLTDGDRVSKAVVCKVPPGRYVSQGLVRICPQGFYREKYLAFNDPAAQVCLACNPGITTAGAGAKSPAECNRVLPGHGISNVFNVSNNPQNIPALPQNETTGLPAATVCPLAFYSANGYCAQCPSGTVTLVLGAKSVEECVVPPGYVVSSGSMVLCSSGTFREGWLMFSDPRATTCTACGDNILSEPRDLDENPLAANGSLVRATSTSCFIEAGQGMIATGRNNFAAKDCPANTYGAADKVYGWAAAPCKPCPRNMITDGATKVNNSDVCVNDDGFGYASEGASRCAPGFYSAKGSRKPCQQCPSGRTTSNAPAQQRVITNCYVLAGFGVVNSTDNATDAFNPGSGGGLLPVLECPVGYYGGGGAIDSKCTPCPTGSTTEASGSTSITQCTVCIAGHGRSAGGPSYGACAPCDYGTYNPGGLATCTACPASTFYPPVDSIGAIYISEGTTLYKGSTSIEACVPKRTQMSPEAGQSVFTPTTVAGLATEVNSISTFSACVAACPANKCCLSQFADNACKQAVLDPAPAAVAGPHHQLVYKLPPSTLVGASSVATDEHTVKAKMMSSGHYAHCNLGDATAVATWLTVGTALGVDARTFQNATAAAVWHSGVTSKAECKKTCDNSNVCIGFIASFTSSNTLSCTYRGGVDLLGGRSFFALPEASAAVDIHSLGW